MRQNDPDIVADRARRLLEDPFLKGTLAEMREALVRSLETTPVVDLEDIEVEREKCRMLRTLGQFTQTLEGHLRAKAIRDAAPTEEP